ncbi:MAG: phosphoenolpyruvate carboxykinase (GTP) [Corynebacterium flavescens]|nr:phosphoenolpyruvate carboxykinase (GTP) [Corynebacterium flavescens]
MKSPTSSADALLAAGIDNPHVREFVDTWAETLSPAAIEVITPDSEEELVAQGLAAGELLPAGRGRYLARSHPLDTARSEERTVVATSELAEHGVYNNWFPADSTKQRLEERLKGACAGKTLYVIPYLMAPPGSPLERFAVGVELSDSRVVALQMIRMVRVGAQFLNGLGEPSFFVRGVHVTGELDSLQQGTAEDERLFATIADERTIIHYGSAYGGNAILAKIAHALRQASYDGWKSGKFLAEQFLLLGIKDKETGETFHVCCGFPSASGKTNLAMTRAPQALGERYEVQFYGDDIAWLWPGEDGRLRAFNPEYGIFGVAKDTNERTNPEAMHAIREGSGTIFTNVAYNELTEEVWWEGKTPQPPEDLAGWRDWKGIPIAERTPEQQGEPWAHPNSRFSTRLSNLDTLAPDYNDPAGVPVDAIIFGGRTSDREPLIRVLSTVRDGVYDGLTLGAEATFAAEGLDGLLRYDPMSMRPFMSYPEGNYAAHWLDILGQCSTPPAFAHVNWFQKNPADGSFLWPGYRDNLRPLLWLWEYVRGNARAEASAIGALPAPADLNLEGLAIDPADLKALLTVDTPRWLLEMERRATHLDQFVDLPAPIWQSHGTLRARLQAAGQGNS